MKLTETNKIWLENISNANACTPECLLNAILRTLRERHDNKTQTVEEWIETAGKAQVFTDALLAEIRKTRVVAEDSVRAARTYLSRIKSQGEAGH